MESLNAFKELGYLVQEPNKDKTYYLVNQGRKGSTTQIWVVLKKDRPVVTIKSNYQSVELIDGSVLSNLIDDFITELGYDDYDLEV